MCTDLHEKNYPLLSTTHNSLTLPFVTNLEQMSSSWPEQVIF